MYKNLKRNIDGNVNSFKKIKRIKFYVINLKVHFNFIILKGLKKLPMILKPKYIQLKKL